MHKDKAKRSEFSSVDVDQYIVERYDARLWLWGKIIHNNQYAHFIRSATQF